MAFAAARPESDTMADMNITPLVDVMLVLLVIFMVTAPLLDYRLDLRLPQPVPERQLPRAELTLAVEPGDLFRLDGLTLSPSQVETTLALWRQTQPEGVVRIVVSPDADYQSAATAMATVQRAGVSHFGLVEP
jgi:biopolymer transport protein ExbD